MKIAKVIGLSKQGVDELGQSDIDQLLSMIPCDAYFKGDTEIMMPDGETCHIDYLEFGHNELVKCPVCFGSGYIWMTGKKRIICHACNGNKTVIVTNKSNN